MVWQSNRRHRRRGKDGEAVIDLENIKSQSVFWSCAPRIRLLVLDMATEIERLDAEKAELLALIGTILSRWSFSNNQQPTHTWHDRSDCATLAAKIISEAVIESITQENP